jgi:hypothetical protein
MHGLETIIAMNERAARGEDTSQLTPEQYDAKRTSRIQHFYGKTLADEARETVDLLGDADILSVHERLLLRFAQEILAHGVIALPEFPERT